jgi:hypothetical protein
MKQQWRKQPESTQVPPVAGDVRDDAVIRVGLADGELAVTYENPA